MKPSISPNGMYYIVSPGFSGLALVAELMLSQVPCLAIRAYVKIKMNGQRAPADMKQVAETIEKIKREELEPGKNYELTVEETSNAIEGGILVPLTTIVLACKMDWSLPEGY